MTYYHFLLPMPDNDKRPNRCNPRSLADQQDGVNAAVVLRIVGDLRVLSPHHLASGRYHAELANVYLDDGALRDDAETRVHGGRGVSLDVDDGQVERGLELRMRHVSLLEPKPRRPNKPLELWRFARKVFWHEGDLGDHALPRLSPLSTLKGPEHLVLGLHAHLGQGDVILCRLVLLLLLHLGRDGLARLLVLAVEQVGGEGTLVGTLGHARRLLFLEGLDLLAQLNLERKKILSHIPIRSRFVHVPILRYQDTALAGTPTYTVK
jgi:hypothetical protein